MYFKLIPKETPVCSDEVTREAFNLIWNKESNCTMAQACETTRFTTTYRIKTNPEGHRLYNKSAALVQYFNPEVLIYNTYISYDLLSLIGEVGGILGLTLGASALTLLETILHKIPYY